MEILKSNNYLAAMKYIKDSADTNEYNESGESVLALSLRYKCDTDLIQLLIENGADIFDFDDEGVSIFDMAVTYDNIEMVEYLIKQGIDVNKTNRRSNFTALMAAACYGRIEIAKLLLDNGANKEMFDSKGFSAVDFARKMNKKSVLKLLEYDVETPNNLGHAR